MIKKLLLILLAILIAVVALVMPTNALVTLLIVAAIAVVGVISLLLYQAIRSILVWINGNPQGLPGQQAPGVHIWIQKSTFAMGSKSGAEDPDPYKPKDPPPPDI